MLFRSRKAVIGDKEITGDNIKDWASLLSLMLNVPVTALAVPASYMRDVSRGKIEPQELLGLPPEVDYIRGMLTGQASAGSK